MSGKKPRLRDVPLGCVAAAALAVPVALVIALWVSWPPRLLLAIDCPASDRATLVACITTFADTDSPRHGPVECHAHPDGAECGYLVDAAHPSGEEVALFCRPSQDAMNCSEPK